MKAILFLAALLVVAVPAAAAQTEQLVSPGAELQKQIGRAACRERV